MWPVAVARLVGDLSLYIVGICDPFLHKNKSCIKFLEGLHFSSCTVLTKAHAPRWNKKSKDGT